MIIFAAPNPPIHSTNQPHKTMAIAIPHQPRYRDHAVPIYYLWHDIVCIRRRPTQVRDPRTPAPLRQRLRLKVGSHFLAPFRPFVQLGFAPELKENLRQVGAYQQALGHLMTYALEQQGDTVRIDPSRVVLSQGRVNPMGAVQVSAAHGKLTVAWSGRLPQACQLVLLGALNRTTGEVLCRTIITAGVDEGLSVALPAGWSGAPLEVWVAPWHTGTRGRYDSTHVSVAGTGTQESHRTAASLSDLIPNGKGCSIRVHNPGDRRIRIPDFYSGRRRC